MPSGILLTKVVNAETFAASEAVIRDTVEKAAEVPDLELALATLLKQNAFLGCCALYKLCLFLYVQFVAVPKTGSTVLQALANDKRNDFIVTSSIISITFLTKAFEGPLNHMKRGLPEMIDPMVSFILSIIIMYAWGSLMVEQFPGLSHVSVDDELLDPIREEVMTATAGLACETDVKAYWTSSAATVEVELNIANPDIPFRDVHNTIDAIQRRIVSLEDIEKVVVVPRWAV